MRSTLSPSGSTIRPGEPARTSCRGASPTGGTMADSRSRSGWRQRPPSTRSARMSCRTWMGRTSPSRFTSVGASRHRCRSASTSCRRQSIRLLLNGDPVAYAGVALHDERVYPAVKGQPRGGPVVTPEDILILLDKANASRIQLIRADHHPANPLLLMLADRLGYAIWEEIPLYHYTPATFAIAMDRGIPQQMLSEMDLRDMNQPSVLFHGLANESTGRLARQH